MNRSAGILLPLSSLPSRYGIGCFSKSAYEFVDWLKGAGQSYWQILPLGPTSYGDSPYQSFSTFAGNPYFISLEALIVMIGKFHFATPGRLGNYTDETAPEDGDQTEGSSTAGTGTKKGNSQAERIIALLGGRENIVLVDACMTRLRVTVKDISKVAELPEWKAEGALGLIKKDQGIQAVYGPKADVLKSDINDIL